MAASLSKSTLAESTSNKTMTRKEILDNAAAAVLKDRQEQYGSPEDSFSTIANFWNTYLSKHAPGPLQSHDVAALLILMKVARIVKTPTHMDNWCDVAGYAACGGDVASQLQACKNPNTSDECAPRSDSSPLTFEELLEVSSKGHLLVEQTLQTLASEERATAEMAVLDPRQFNWGAYKRLMSII